jgi:hypothetical protein
MPILVIVSGNIKINAFDKFVVVVKHFRQAQIARAIVILFYLEGDHTFRKSDSLDEIAVDVVGGIS